DEEVKKEQDRKRSLEYFKDIRRVQEHLNNWGEPMRAREWLERWDAKEGEIDYRGWEWYLLMAQSREMVLSVRGHTSAVSAVAWSPDGARLASSDVEGHVKVWSVVDGQELLQLPPEPGGVSALAWSKDGKCLAAVDERTVELWDPDSGRKLQTLQRVR